ncbi:c-type cytochrome [Azotobacter chroococcum]|uniref:ABC transporter substrate-binding protein n=1 Tax=Azotobacter chroococcum TaxID=353 RepID=UPI00103B4555|nr:ABC transporter substrate-binding protein [Azotobacter chroococcum]TBW09025.1 c-type cytochrome [Azotobacter chroococcum]
MKFLIAPTRERGGHRQRAWLLAALLGWAGLVGALELTPEEAAGRRLYREGLGAGDTPVEARVGPAGTAMPASVLPCAGCHGSDGRGRPEGAVRPPEITWRRLATARPAYDAAGLARALGEGLDPAGERLDPAMPRFVMSWRDLANLGAYLKRLEEDRDPGLHETRLRLGTLLPSAGPLAAAGKIVGALLQAALDELNQAGGIHGRRLELVIADPGPDRASAEAALAGLLDGGEVFALLAPLAPALEARYGTLLAPRGVPLVGPLPGPDGEEGPLVFAPLAGLREQLFALAGFAAGESPPGESPALIAYPPEAARQAEALAARLRAHGWKRVRLFDYGAAQADGEAPLTADLEVLFFLGSGEALLALGRALDGAGLAPRLYASAQQAAGAALRLPPAFSGRLFLAYPLLPADVTPAGAQALEALRRRAGLDAQQPALQIGAYSATLLLAEGLKRAGRDASRERLLRELENLHALHTGVTPPLGFGPGRRVGAAGAHIVGVDLAAGRFVPTGRYVRVEP